MGAKRIKKRTKQTHMETLEFLIDTSGVTVDGKPVSEAEFQRTMDQHFKSATDADGNTEYTLFNADNEPEEAEHRQEVSAVESYRYERDLKEPSDGNYVATAERRYFWVCLCKRTVTMQQHAHTRSDIKRWKITPTPEALIGFPTREEADRVMRFIRDGQFAAVSAQINQWLTMPGRVVKYKHPQEDNGEGVVWTFDPNREPDEIVD